MSGKFLSDGRELYWQKEPTIKAAIFEAIDFDVNPSEVNGDYIRKGWPEFTRAF